jgi:hypothetical protein
MDASEGRRNLAHRGDIRTRREEYLHGLQVALERSLHQRRPSANSGQ